MMRRGISRNQICDDKQTQWTAMIMTEGASMFPPDQTKRESEAMAKVMRPKKAAFRVDRPVSDRAEVCVNLKMCLFIEGHILPTYGWSGQK